MQRHQRCQCRQREQQIEHQGNDAPQERHRRKSLLENGGQGDEHQRGSAVGTHAHAERRRENHQTRQNGHQRVDKRNLHRRAQQVGLSAVVAGVGAEAAHGDAQRIERLAKRSEEDAASDFRKVGLQQKIDALPGVGQHARGDHDDQQQDEQHGHEQLRGALNAMANATTDNQMAKNKDGYRPKHGHDGRRRERLEIVLGIAGIALQLAHHGSIDVLQAPTTYHSIVAGDEKSRENAERANKRGKQRLPASCFSHLLVGTSRVGCSMTTDNQFTHHARQPQHNHTSQINQDECRTAVLTRHVGETPHVAQADCRPCRGQNHTQHAAEICSFCCLLHSYFLLSIFKSGCKIINKLEEKEIN